MSCSTALDPAAPADLIPSYCALLPVTVISEILGVPPAQRNRVLEMGTRAAPSLDFGLGWRRFRAVTAGLRDFDQWLDAHIEQLRRHPGEDLLSQLIEARDEQGTLNDRELKATAGLVLAAGFETTVNLLGNAIALLDRHPGQLARLRADSALWPNAVDEALRLDPPVLMTGRVCARPTSVAGHRAAGRRAGGDPVGRREPRPGGVRRIPSGSTWPGRTPAITSRSPAAVTTASAPRSPGWRARWASEPSPSDSRTCTCCLARPAPDPGPARLRDPARPPPLAKRLRQHGADHGAQQHDRARDSGCAQPLSEYRRREHSGGERLDEGQQGGGPGRARIAGRSQRSVTRPPVRLALCDLRQVRAQIGDPLGAHGEDRTGWGEGPPRGRTTRPRRRSCGAGSGRATIRMTSTASRIVSGVVGRSRSRSGCRQGRAGHGQVDELGALCRKQSTCGPR